MKIGNREKLKQTDLTEHFIISYILVFENKQIIWDFKHYYLQIKDCNIELIILKAYF